MSAMLSMKLNYIDKSGVQKQSTKLALFAQSVFEKLWTIDDKAGSSNRHPRFSVRTIIVQMSFFYKVKYTFNTVDRHGPV